MALLKISLPLLVLLGPPMKKWVEKIPIGRRVLKHLNAFPEKCVTFLKIKSQPLLFDDRNFTLTRTFMIVQLACCALLAANFYRLSIICGNDRVVGSATYGERSQDHRFQRATVLCYVFNRICDVLNSCFFCDSEFFSVIPYDFYPIKTAYTQKVFIIFTFQTTIC